jgi:hypothetical protein
MTGKCFSRKPAGSRWNNNELNMHRGSRTVTESQTCFHLGRSADLPRAADIGTRLGQGVTSGRAEHQDKLKWREDEDIFEQV